MNTGRARALVALLTLFSAACGDTNPTGVAGPGMATISLVTPNTDDGAVVISLRGVGFSNVQSASSAYRVYWRLVSAEEVRLIVIGNLSAGPLATAGVSDVGAVRNVAAVVSEVASRSDALRPSLAGYAAALTAIGGGQ